VKKKIEVKETVNKKKMLVYVSEVASLCGCSEKFFPCHETVKKVLSRSPREEKQALSYERSFGPIMFRGRANYSKDDIPVLVRKRANNLSCKLWPQDEIQCFTLAFLYNQTSCFFIEKCRSEEYVIEVKFQKEKWLAIIQTMCEKLQLRTDFDCHMPDVEKHDDFKVEKEELSDTGTIEEVD